MKKKLLVCAAVFSLLAAVFVSCSDDDDESENTGFATSIAFDQDEYRLTVSDVTKNSQQIVATIKPSGATVKWLSTNTDVVVVDDTGLLAAVNAGSAAVYAQSGATIAVATVVVDGASDSSGGTKSIIVRDTDGEQVVNFSLATEKYRTMQLVPYVTAATEQATEEKALGTDVIWSTSDEKVAVVSNNGLVVALKKGVAGITARVPDTDKFYIATLTVKDYVPVTSITITKLIVDEKDVVPTENSTGNYSYTAAAGTKTIVIEACCENSSSDEEPTHQVILWKSNDEEVATVENGVVTVLKSGTVTITATAEDDDDTTPPVETTLLLTIGSSAP